MPNPLFDALFAPLAGRDTALMILADGEQITGDAFFRLLARQANALAAQGLVKGDRIAVQVAKTPEALALYAAATALGAIFLPLNTAYTADEVDYFLGNATPRLFLCDAARGGACPRRGTAWRKAADAERRWLGQPDRTCRPRP